MLISPWLYKDIANEILNDEYSIQADTTFLMCWTPYAVIAFIKCFVSDMMIGAMESILPTVVVKVSICANPLLYIAYNPKLSKPYEVNEYSTEKEEKHSPNEIQTEHIIFDMTSYDTL